MNTHAARIAAQLDAWFSARTQEAYYKHKKGQPYELYLTYMPIRGVEATAFMFSARDYGGEYGEAHRLYPAAAEGCTWVEFRTAVVDEVERVVQQLMELEAEAA